VANSRTGPDWKNGNTRGKTYLGGPPNVKLLNPNP